jgi:hypothetical protein
LCELGANAKFKIPTTPPFWEKSKHEEEREREKRGEMLLIVGPKIYSWFGQF